MQGAVAARAEGHIGLMQPAPGDDPIPLPQAAFRELLHGRGLYGADPSSRTLAPYRRDAVSLPEDVSDAQLFTDFGGERYTRYTEGEGRRMVRDLEARLTLLQDSGIVPCCDPQLLSGRKMVSFYVRRTSVGCCGGVRGHTKLWASSLSGRRENSE